MQTYAIDSDNNITVFTAAEQIPEGQEHFATENELAKLAANWTGDRLILIWNGFAGVTPFDDLKPVKKFTDRKSAVARIWKAIQRLDAAAASKPAAPAAEIVDVTPEATQPSQESTAVAPQAADVAPEAAPPSQDATAETAAPQARTVREGSKTAIVLDMIKRPNGATLKDIVAATKWQANSVRGFISGAITKKMGLKVESFKTENGDRAYRIPC